MSMDKIDNKLDLTYIFKHLNNMERIINFIFDEDQLKIFEIIPNEKICSNKIPSTKLNSYINLES